MTFSLGVVLAELTAGADAQSACPDLSSFRYWMEEYVTRCQPTANSTCDWVTCDCLQVRCKYRWSYLTCQFASRRVCNHRPI